AMRTSNQLAPRPARPVPPPDRHLKEFENTSPLHQSRARPAVPRHRSATPHPTAVGETPRIFPPPAENRLPLKPPELPRTRPAAHPARSPPPTDMSVGNTRPPDDVQVATSRSNMRSPYSTSPPLTPGAPFLARRWREK